MGKVQKVSWISILAASVVVVSGCSTNSVTQTPNSVETTQGQSASVNTNVTSGMKTVSAKTVSYPSVSYPKDTNKVTLTVWNWNNNFQKQIKVFNKYYPNIHVNLQNVGSGQTEYQKLITAINTGKGAPDLAMIEYSYLPQFIQSGGIANISKYDSSYSKYFPTWVWNQVKYNGGLYAIPSDVGPMGLYYQPLALQKDHLSVPKTWNEFQKDAAIYHKDNPGKYYSVFFVNDGQWMLSMLWQAGVTPFQSNGDTWKIDLNSPGALKVMKYWGSLVQTGAVQVGADFSPSFMKSVSAGDYATIPGSVWFSGTIQLAVAPGSKNWKAAFLPNWSSSAPLDSDWGGSSNAVTSQSKHPREAALLASFLSTNEQTISLATAPIASGGSSSFTSNKFAADLPVMKTPIDVLGGQPAYADIFSKANLAVGSKFEYPPFATYVYNDMSVEFQKAFDHRETWATALNNLQSSVTQFARSQGYSVSS